MLVLAPLVFAACNRAPEPDATQAAPKPIAPASQLPSAAPAPSNKVTELSWDPPASWTRVENASPMRKATYRIPKQEKDAEAPELAVTVAGGSVDANVDRWIGQFDEAAKKTLVRTTKKLGPYEATIVELRGTFSGGGMPGAPSSPKSGWALLAAVVPVGHASWFFKMTGPEASVLAARKDFDALLATVR